MNLSIELEREPGLTVSQWERFLGQGRRAGAAGDTPVSEVMCTGSGDIIHSYRVEIPCSGPAAAPEQVTLPAALVHEMLNVIGEVAKSDGDVRGVVDMAQRVMQAGYDHLLVPILGMNDYWIEPSEE